LAVVPIIVEVGALDADEGVEVVKALDASLASRNISEIIASSAGRIWGCWTTGRAHTSGVVIVRTFTGLIGEADSAISAQSSRVLEVESIAIQTKWTISDACAEQALGGDEDVARTDAAFDGWCSLRAGIALTLRWEEGVSVFTAQRTIGGEEETVAREAGAVLENECTAAAATGLAGEAGAGHTLGADEGIPFADGVAAGVSDQTAWNAWAILKSEGRTSCTQDSRHETAAPQALRSVPNIACAIRTVDHVGHWARHADRWEVIFGTEQASGGVGEGLAVDARTAVIDEDIGRTERAIRLGGRWLAVDAASEQIEVGWAETAVSIDGERAANAALGTRQVIVLAGGAVDCVGDVIAEEAAAIDEGEPLAAVTQLAWVSQQTAEAGVVRKGIVFWGATFAIGGSGCWFARNAVWILEEVTLTLGATSNRGENSAVGAGATDHLVVWTGRTLAGIQRRTVDALRLDEGIVGTASAIEWVACRTAVEALHSSPGEARTKTASGQWVGRPAWLAHSWNEVEIKADTGVANCQVSAIGASTAAIVDEDTVGAKTALGSLVDCITGHTDGSIKDIGWAKQAKGLFEIHLAELTRVVVVGVSSAEITLWSFVGNVAGQAFCKVEKVASAKARAIGCSVLAVDALGADELVVRA
jgi:hypothetical protein